MTVPAFTAESVLSQLKDFQRRTVEYAFHRLYHPIDPSRRFLVADEVGLGKTMVAKGLIARAIEHLQGQVERIDVVYVCSNSDIAAQNVSRLMMPGMPSFARATRLTLLPLEVQELRENRINFISFTPGTTFNHGNRTGRKEERRLIYQMLASLPDIDRKGLRNAFKGAASNKWYSEADIELRYDNAIAESFRIAVIANPSLRERLYSLSDAYRDRRFKLASEVRESCSQLIGELRQLLATTCLAALEPDLVILDEFQRFGELLDPAENNPAAELAQALFNYSKELKVLLLSATPYKMYAMNGDEEDHYRDFIRTVRFLIEDESTVGLLTRDIACFRSGLMKATALEQLRGLEKSKRRIETVLQRVMCRTERVGLTTHRDAMVGERLLSPALSSGDLRDLRTMDAVSRCLGQSDMLELWKSSPYLANFMKEYNFKRALIEDAGRPEPLSVKAFAASPLSLLDAELIERFGQLNPGNARLRTLHDEIETSGLWRLLWMPPSLPYWRAEGVFNNVGSVSKQLIFSSWNVVPDAIAALTSYHVEQLLMGHAEKRATYSTVTRRFTQQLKFSRKGDGKLGGMTALMLMFPSRALVGLLDFAKLMAGPPGLVDYATLRETAKKVLEPYVEPLVDRQTTEGLVDRRWYWVALARLEASRGKEVRSWCEKAWGEAAARDDEGDGTSAFQAHVEHWLKAWDGYLEGLGRVPDDLLGVLVDIAFAGPANCALRALLSIGESNRPEAADLSAAALAAEGLRRQFNTPQAVALLSQAEDEDSYWKAALRYAIEGNLQAVLDEYTHQLAEPLSSSSKPMNEIRQGVADAMFRAMTLRTATLQPDHIEIRNGHISIGSLPHGLRSHFALRFGSAKEEQGAIMRKESVQAAFNSPFWPFYLASTSVGQEGLDFHTWCHSVVHWNLPSNPVDMEQREGRVHRYKGYAVRKNIAATFRARVTLASQGDGIWAELFRLAADERGPNCSDLVPYWIFEREGGAVVERRVLVAPLSRDAMRYQRMRKSLALYRMVFAQPRQEDLLACLEGMVSQDEISADLAHYRIQLEPRDTSAFDVLGQERTMNEPLAAALEAK